MIKTTEQTLISGSAVTGLIIMVVMGLFFALNEMPVNPAEGTWRCVPVNLAVAASFCLGLSPVPRRRRAHAISQSREVL